MEIKYRHQLKALAFFIVLAHASRVWARAEAPLLELGSLRFSHELSLEGVTHRLQDGWRVRESASGLDKLYSVDGSDKRSWNTTWGAHLLTEVATRVNKNISGRVLFELQGDYADRFWRPNNINNHTEIKGENFILRQAEANIKQERWYLNAFSGVAHADWYAQGDFFRLYPESYPDSGYLGSSAYFGVYPQSWNQDQFLNVTKTRIPQGAELGADVGSLNGAVAFGEELGWGLRKSAYGRLGLPLGQTKLTYVYKHEDAPEDIENPDRYKTAQALSWAVPFGAHRFDVGVVYQPYRHGERYEVVRKTRAGEGILGSNRSISEKTAIKEDGLGGKSRLEIHPVFFNREWISTFEVSYLGVLVGNKEQADFSIGTNLTESIQFDTQYMYRRPVEDPIPFLYEGTADNIGAVAASPRGSVSPFTVNWFNREAVSLQNTVWCDPTPGSRMFLYDPHAVSGWNLNPKESSALTLALQHRMTDYRSTTDRQYYYDSNGNLIWESGVGSGAWPSDEFLHEFRILGHGKLNKLGWTLGVAGGQLPALSGLAYTNNTARLKPITEYVSVEGRIERWPFAVWSHFGSGVWGPEVNTDPFFGNSFDRLWGVGASYSMTVNTTWDIGYLAARQDDSLFVTPTLGSYDEIRTTFSHRFGFQLQFQEL